MCDGSYKAIESWKSEEEAKQKWNQTNSLKIWKCKENEKLRSGVWCTQREPHPSGGRRDNRELVWRWLVNSWRICCVEVHEIRKCHLPWNLSTARALLKQLKKLHQASTNKSGNKTKSKEKNSMRNLGEKYVCRMKKYLVESSKTSEFFLKWQHKWCQGWAALPCSGRIPQAKTRKNVGYIHMYAYNRQTTCLLLFRLYDFLLFSFYDFVFAAAL